VPSHPLPHPAPTQPKHAKQTGPKTPAGKARSRMNAARHGLRAAAAALPGEDPAEYDQFVTGILESLAPAGPLEEELARQAAAALWRLRRADAWEAARARLAAHADPGRVADRAAAADAEIEGLRAELANSQKDPAADPPFAVRLASLPDDTPVDPLDVTELWNTWADDLPDPDAAPTLEQMCDRAGLPEAVASQPGDSPGWTAGLARRLAAEFAKEAGLTLEAYLAGQVEGWQAGLADERARRRLGRAGLKRQIAAAEQRKRDLAVDQTGPEAARADLLARYQAGAQRAFDKALKALHAVQQARTRRVGRDRAAG
jgi:hypothetical protein